MKIKFMAVLVFFLLTSSSINSFAAGYTLDENQKRNARGFQAIKVSTGIDLMLSMGEEEAVRVEAKKDIINDVITEVKNGTLHVYMKKKQGFNIFNWHNYSTVKVYVSAVELNRLKTSAGAEIKSETTLKGDALEVDASSGGNAKIDVVYKNISVSASSGAHLKISGRAKYLEAGTSSGGTIDAQDLKAEYCNARASSGGDVSVYTSTELTAKASSGGNIRYSGKPETKNISKSSGGSVYSR